MSLKAKIDTFVEELLKKADDKTVSVPEKVDVLKAATAWFAATQKRGKKGADEDEPPAEPEGFTFGGLRDERGSSAVPARRDS